MKTPQKKLEYNRKYRQKMASKGFCDCGEKNNTNKSRCSKCQEKNKQYMKNRQEKRRKSGLCIYCGKIVETNAKTCFVCRQQKSNRLQELRLLALEHYGKLCACCGEKELVFLCIDHINEDGFEHRKKIGGSLYQWLSSNNYPVGFQTLCWNCNSAKYLLGNCPHQQKSKLLD